MATKLNGTVYAHADGAVTVTPLEGDNAGVPFACKKVKSAEFDLGAASTKIEGFDISPDAIVATSATPTWNVELSAVGEAAALALHIGPGAVQIPCNVTYTLSRRGLPKTTYDVEGTLITKGIGGVKSDNGSAPNGSVGGDATNIKLNGVDLLNLPK
jgi:hypothetical protein